MPVESAVYLDTLVPANPLSSDGVSAGDDHIRLLKAVLQATFPNLSAAMTATAAELNATEGRLDALEAADAAFDNGTSITSISGVLEVIESINAVTTADYAILTANRGKLITRTNASMADTIAQAGSAGFPAGWFCYYENIDTAVFATITPATSTINGAASLSVPPGYRVKITSDGTNYKAYMLPIAGDAWRRVAKTANYTLVPADLVGGGMLVLDFTTAGVTLDTAVAASNFLNRPFLVMNTAASGDVTFNPNSTETVRYKGLTPTTLVLRPGESALIIADSSNWRVLFLDVASTPVAAKTANYALTAADNDRSFLFSSLSGDVTLTLPAVATVPVGFKFKLSVEGSELGASVYGVTVDGNGAEVLDLAASRRGCAGTRVEIQSDGTRWRTTVGTWVFISNGVAPTITTENTAFQAHTVPTGNAKAVSFYLECTSADGNYVAGDTMWYAGETNAAGTSMVVVGADGTNVFYTIGSGGLRSANKTTNAGFVLDTTKWLLHIVVRS